MRPAVSDQARSWRLGAEAEHIGPLRNEVAEFLRANGVDEQTTNDVRLAVSEAVTNSVLHGYVAREQGSVEVNVTRTDDMLEVTVADDGAGIRPRPDSPGLGLGLPLIANLAESFSMETAAAGGSVLTMAFRVGREAA